MKKLNDLLVLILIKYTFTIEQIDISFNIKSNTIFIFN